MNEGAGERERERERERETFESVENNQSSNNIFSI